MSISLGSHGLERGFNLCSKGHEIGGESISTSNQGMISNPRERINFRSPRRTIQLVAHIENNGPITDATVPDAPMPNALVPNTRVADVPVPDTPLPDALTQGSQLSLVASALMNQFIIWYPRSPRYFLPVIGMIYGVDIW